MSETEIMRNDPQSQPATALLFIHAQTSLHPGSGTALGVVDLPVQRERHTQWPVIPGSALKGILRDACREEAKLKYEDVFEDKLENGQTVKVLKRSKRQIANEEHPMLVAAFGPGKVQPDTSHAGAISLTDARILAFPVRSLRGVFAWVTCKAVLERLNRDLKLAGQRPVDLDLNLAKEEAGCPKNSPLLVDGDRLVLEEFEFKQSVKSESVADWIGRQSVADTATQNRIKSHLVILHDDDFTHFVRHATEIIARIGLDYERKTVKTGALFYQECLPAETLFYSVVFANDSRYEKHREWKAGAVLSYLDERLKAVKILQVGGDETTGKGLCAVRLSNGKEGAK